MYKKGQRTRLDATVRKIETIFYNEKQIRRAVMEARQDKGGFTGGTGGHAFISDPTANQAIRNVEEIKKVVIDQETIIHYPERWLKVIDATYNNLDPLSRDAVKMRYKGYHWRQICDKLNFSRHMYHTILDDAQNYATAAACQVGVLSIM